MLDWLHLVELSDAALARHDVAVINHACATGLPGAEDWSADAGQRILDNMAEHVQFESDRHSYRFRNAPQDYENSPAYFRLLLLATILQQDCGVGYNKDLLGRRDEEFPHNVETLFLHGILKGKGGSCASLPVLYLAVGRHLGYPLKLVAAHNHWFIRWDDPATGVRINMECSNQGGFSTFPDDHYLRWPVTVSLEQARLCRLLQSMSPREELAVFLEHRSDCWMALGICGPALQARAIACSLAPDNMWYRDRLAFGINRWMDDLEGLFPPNFPAVRYRAKHRRYRNIPADLEQGIIQAETYDALLKTQREPHRSWWTALRRSPEERPPQVPAVISIEDVDRCIGYHRNQWELYPLRGGTNAIT